MIGTDVLFTFLVAPNVGYDVIENPINYHKITTYHVLQKKLKYRIQQEQNVNVVAQQQQQRFRWHLMQCRCEPIFRVKNYLNGS